MMQDFDESGFPTQSWGAKKNGWGARGWTPFPWFLFEKTDGEQRNKRKGKYRMILLFLVGIYIGSWGATILAEAVLRHV